MSAEAELLPISVYRWNRETRTWELAGIFPAVNQSVALGQAQRRWPHDVLSTVTPPECKKGA